MNIKAASFYSLMIVQSLLALPPVVLTYRLYRLAQRAATLIGRWPVPMQNDPKWIGPHDSVYQHLYNVADQADMIAFSSFFVWIGVMSLDGRWYTPRTCLAQGCFFVLTWGLLWLNPWSLLYWWED